MGRPGSTRNLTFEEPNLAFEQQNFAFEQQNFDLRNSDNFAIKSYSITILSIVWWNMNEYNVIRGAVVKNSACRALHGLIPIWVTKLHFSNRILHLSNKILIWETVTISIKNRIQSLFWALYGEIWMNTMSYAARRSKIVFVGPYMGWYQFE